MPATRATTFYAPGDTLWYCGRGFESRVIGLGTGSVPQLIQGRLFSHCSVIDGNCRNVESTTLNDKATDELRRPIRGVQWNDPNDRVNDYSGRVYLARLNRRDALNRREARRLTEFLAGIEGVPYDMTGAILAGTTWIKKLFAPDATSMFCSEMVAMALMDIKKLDRDFNPSTITPAALVRRLVNGGLYEPLVRLR